MSAAPLFLQQHHHSGHTSSKNTASNRDSASSPLRSAWTQDGGMTQQLPPVAGSQTVDGLTNGDTSKALQAQILPDYSFPDRKLKKTLDDSSKTPLVLIACGSFSPITYLHLRMFEMVADHAKFNTEFEVVGGYLSPVSDAYKKKGLATAEHRINMCRIASEPAPWLTVDPWEASHEEYTRTALVLDHFDHEINVVRRGIATKNGERKQAKVALLAGADLIGTMSTPGVWSEPDLDHILGQYGAFIIERNGTDINDALSHLKRWEQNIWVIPQLIQNDVSSTKIRSFLDRKMSVNYLIPAAVIKYIEQYGLYEDGQLQSRPNSGSSTPTSDNNDAQKSNN